MKKLKKISALFAPVLLALLLSSCAYFGAQESTGKEEHVHKVLHWEVVHTVDCENGGRRFGVCIDCKNEVRDEQEALGHEFRNGTCARCGKEEKKGEDNITEKPEESFKFALANKSYTLVSGAGFSGEVLEIPAEYNGLPVTAIAADAFHKNYYVSKVIIPDSVSTVGTNAFYACENLKEVVFGSGVESLGDYAFFECRELERVILPEKTTSIGHCCFSYCTKLSGVEAPALVSIGNNAFYLCESLDYFDYPETLERIGDNAFASSALTNAELPERLLLIGDGAFSSSMIKTVRLPGSVKRVGSNAFASCPMLESVVIEGDFSSIDSSFSNIFSHCDNLKTITFAEGVTVVNSDVLGYCENIETVMLPKSLKTMNELFANASKLKKIIYAGTLEEWLEVKRNLYWLFFPENCTLECTDGSYTREQLREAETSRG